MTRPVSENASHGAKRSATLAKLSVFEWSLLDRELSAIGESIRADVVRRFRALGGSFARCSRLDAVHAVDALVAAEDALELSAGGRMTKARLALRDVRRGLESAVDP